jgi:hypothetical protein
MAQVSGTRTKQAAQTSYQDHSEAIDIEPLGWMSQAPPRESGAGNFPQFVRLVVKRYYWQEYSNIKQSCLAVIQAEVRLNVSFAGSLNWESTRSIMASAVAEAPVNPMVKARAQADVGVSSKSSFSVQVGLTANVTINVGQVVAHVVARQAGLGAVMTWFRDTYTTASGAPNRRIALWRPSSGTTVHRWSAGNPWPASSCPPGEVDSNGIMGTAWNTVFNNHIMQHYDHQRIRLR